MKINIGGIDRVLRVAVGLFMVSGVFIGPQTLWGWVGVIPLLTGLFRFCPFYSLLGLNTCPLRNQQPVH